MNDIPDRKLCHLRFALLLAARHERESLLQTFLQLSRNSRPQPTKIHNWPIAEVPEDESPERLLHLRARGRNPLYTVAVRRLVPYMTRKCLKVVAHWRLRTVQQSACVEVQRSSVVQQRAFRALNSIGKRQLVTAFTTWKTVKLEVEEEEETRFTVRRTVVMERITYLRPQAPPQRDYKPLRKALFGDKQRELLVLTRSFSRLHKPPALPTAPLPRQSLQQQRLDALGELRRCLAKRIGLTLSFCLGVLTPRPPVYAKHSGYIVLAFSNMIIDLLNGNVYRPVWERLKGEEASSKSSEPITGSTSLLSGSSLKVSHFMRLIRRRFRHRLRWAFKLLAASYPKKQRRRFYRIQKGLKALYNASILSVQNEVFELLKFLLFLEGRRFEKILNFPLMAYPTQSIVACQRLIRGFLARRRVGKLRLATQPLPSRLSQRYRDAEAFAVQVQKLARGFLARRRVAKLRERPSVRTALLQSRTIVLAQVVQKAINKHRAAVLAKLVIRKRRQQTRFVIRLQRGSKSLLRAMKSISLRRLSALPYSVSMADRYPPKSKARHSDESVQKQCTTDRPNVQLRHGERRLTEQRRVSMLVGRTLTDSKEDALEERKREETMYQQKRQQLVSLLKAEKTCLAALQTQMEDRKRRLDSATAKAETQSRMAQARRRRESQFIEKQVTEQAQRKAALSDVTAAAQSAVAVCEERRAVCREEIRTWECMLEEYVAEREEAEELLADFQRTHPDPDVKTLVGALSSREILSRCAAKQHFLSSKLESVELQLSVATKDCFLLSSERQSLVPKLRELSDPRLEQSVKAVEERIAGEWTALEEVVASLNREAGFDVDEQILRKQVEVVEQQVAALEKEYTLDSTDLEERILETPDSSAQSVRLRTQAQALKRNQLNRLAAIAHWKREALSLLSCKVTAAPKPVSDELVLDEVRVRLRKERRQSTEKLVAEYAQLLRSKEERLQTSEYRAVSERLVAVERELRTAADRKVALQLEKGRMRAELKEVAIVQRNAEAGTVHTAHPLHQTADLLVSRITHWEELVEYATFRLKSLLGEYREVDAQAHDARHKLALARRDLDSTETQLREHQSKLQSLSQTPTPDSADAVDSFQLKAELTELGASIVQSTATVESLEADLSQLEVDRSDTQQQEAPRIKRSGLMASRSDIDLQHLEESKETREDSEETAAAAGLDKSARSNSEFHGTSRSRSLLRMSVPRMLSRSPVESREEDLVALLDLDDDLDQLLDSPVESLPRRPLPDNIPQLDRDFYEKVIPLLDGSEIYKKYSQTTSLKQKAFDPLLARENPPDVCGFGLRTFRLARSLQYVEVRQGLKGVVESSFPIDQIHAPMIPQATMAILKAQKRLLRRRHHGKQHIENLSLRYREMKEGGFVNVNSVVYEEMSRDCCHYPFSIILVQSGRVEIVAPTYYTFKTWVNGLNALLKRRTDLPDLSVRIPTSRRWV